MDGKTLKELHELNKRVDRLGDLAHHMLHQAKRAMAASNEPLVDRRVAYLIDETVDLIGMANKMDAHLNEIIHMLDEPEPDPEPENSGSDKTDGIPTVNAIFFKVKEGDNK